LEHVCDAASTEKIEAMVTASKPKSEGCNYFHREEMACSHRIKW
jgi:hypothetical protein